MTPEQFQEFVEGLQFNSASYVKFLMGLKQEDLDNEYQSIRSALLGRPEVRTLVLYWNQLLDCIIVERNRRLSTAPSIR